MSPNAAPILHTERLTLRGHRLGDFEPSAAMWGDEAVTRFIGGRPFTREEAWTRLLRYVGHWPLMGFGYWAVEERASGAFLGEVGFAERCRIMTPSIEGYPEIGWAFAPAAQGKGFAREAVGAAVAWGDAHLVERRTVALIDAAHARSIAIAEAMGFVDAGIADYHGPLRLFERIAP